MIFVAWSFLSIIPSLSHHLIHSSRDIGKWRRISGINNKVNTPHLLSSIWLFYIQAFWKTKSGISISSPCWSCLLFLKRNAEEILESKFSPLKCDRFFLQSFISPNILVFCYKSWRGKKQWKRGLHVDMQEALHFLSTSLVTGDKNSENLSGIRQYLLQGQENKERRFICVFCWMGSWKEQNPV